MHHSAACTLPDLIPPLFPASLVRWSADLLSEVTCIQRRLRFSLISELTGEYSAREPTQKQFLAIGRLKRWDTITSGCRPFHQAPSPKQRSYERRPHHRSPSPVHYRFSAGKQMCQQMIQSLRQSPRHQTEETVDTVSHGFTRLPVSRLKSNPSALKLQQVINLCCPSNVDKDQSANLELLLSA